MLILLCIPLTIFASVMYLGNQRYNVTALLVLPQFKPVLALVIIAGVAFGAFAAVIIYGGIMNPASAIMYSSASLNWEVILACYVSGLPMDLIHAAATVVSPFIAAEPMLEKLDRIKVKYGLVE